ncbi:uncharacterized protein [Nicotiana sylvestris]|uniref:uncharacterized protein n=1 Tax=Nicotiana sylvestris TaxID=4096 RepID=UPI00388C342D
MARTRASFFADQHSGPPAVATPIRGRIQTPAANLVGVIHPVAPAPPIDGAAMSIDALWRLDKFIKLFPVHFSGETSKYPQEYLDSCHKVLRNISILETNGVDFVAFQMTGSAKKWWRDYLLTKLVGLSALTWDQFSHLFLEKFLHVTTREEKRRQFERLQQGNMIVTHYENHFVELARHAILLFPAERDRRGLTRDLAIPVVSMVPRLEAWLHLAEASLPGHFIQHYRLHLPVYSAPSAPIRAPPLQSYYRGQPACQGIISVCDKATSVLFDPGSTYSYVSSYFASYLIVPRDSLSVPVYVSTPVGDAIVVDHVYRSCIVVIEGLETSVDLLLLDMVDFDVILGMDWLLPYYTILDCHAKTVTLALSGLP